MLCESKDAASCKPSSAKISASNQPATSKVQAMHIPETHNQTNLLTHVDHQWKPTGNLYVPESYVLAYAVHHPEGFVSHPYHQIKELCAGVVADYVIGYTEGGHDFQQLRIYVDHELVQTDPRQHLPAKYLPTLIDTLYGTVEQFSSMLEYLGSQRFIERLLDYFSLLYEHDYAQYLDTETNTAP